MFYLVCNVFALIHETVFEIHESQQKYCTVYELSHCTGREGFLDVQNFEVALKILMRVQKGLGSSKTGLGDPKAMMVSKDKEGF